MEKKGTFKIISESKLIVEFFSGDIIMNDIKHMQKVIGDEANYNPTFDLIIDFRETNLIVTEDDMIGYSDFIKEQSKLYGKRKAAYLTSNPNEVVKGTLFSTLIEDLPIESNVFSTTDAIFAWLNRDGINNQLLLLIINELKTQPNTLYK